MIASYSQCQHGEKALNYLKQMQLEGASSNKSYKTHFEPSRKSGELAPGNAMQCCRNGCQMWHASSKEIHADNDREGIVVKAILMLEQP